MANIAFIGSGNMASAILGGLINNGTSPKNIWACDPSEEKLNQLNAQFGVNVETQNKKAIAVADVVILSVKPQVMEQVIAPLKATLEEKRPLIISVAAGINLYSLNAWCGAQQAIVRCMPNTPALVGKGASGLFANEHVSEEQRALSESILDAVGMSVWVNTEDELDIVTAISGSGPAYYFLFMEAMTAAGEAMGLSAETSEALVLQTALGAATMASESDLPAAQLRKNVTSPKGTTEQAILSFQNNGLESLVAKAMEAVRRRSHELAEELGEKP